MSFTEKAVVMATYGDGCGSYVMDEKNFLLMEVIGEPFIVLSLSIGLSLFYLYSMFTEGIREN